MEAYMFIEGTRHRFPVTPYEAVEFGWHKGADYRSPLHPDSPYDVIREWCKQTYSTRTYALFFGSVWFLYEHDAVLCKLRWS
jgi:hypothetical protein